MNLEARPFDDSAMNFTHEKPSSPPLRPPRAGLLAWSAWARVLAMVPVLVLLWLAVLWTGLTTGPAA